MEMPQSIRHGNIDLVGNFVEREKKKERAQSIGSECSLVGNR